MLNARQLRAYRSRVDVWRKGTRTFSGTGAPTEAAYFRIRTAMPGLWDYTQNDSDPTQVGRIKRRTALTEDGFHAEVNEDLRDTDILVDVSLLADGSNSPNIHTMARIQGEPRKIPNFGGRRVNAQIVQTMSIPRNEWPAEIAAAYP